MLLKNDITPENRWQTPRLVVIAFVKTANVPGSSSDHDAASSVS